MRIKASDAGGFKNFTITDFYCNERNSGSLTLREKPDFIIIAPFWDNYPSAVHRTLENVSGTTTKFLFGSGTVTFSKTWYNGVTNDSNVSVTWDGNVTVSVTTTPSPMSPDGGYVLYMCKYV